MGSLFYAWMAIRNLWNRPLLLKYKNITDSSSGIVNKSEYNSVESLRINIEIAKYKRDYFFDSSYSTNGINDIKVNTSNYCGNT